MVTHSTHHNPPRDGSPRDLAINERQDIFFAADGDFAVVNGRTNVKQSAAIDVLHVVADDIGGTIRPTTINKIESEIRDVLEADPQVATVVSVEPSSYDTERNELKFAVQTVADDDYEIPLQSLADSYTTEGRDDTTVRYDVADEKHY